jgi:hypothetical protein
LIKAQQENKTGISLLLDFCIDEKEMEYGVNLVALGQTCKVSNLLYESSEVRLEDKDSQGYPRFITEEK